MTEQQITLPNGRHFSFENTYRLRHGGVTNSTSIKNYPVQGFATADIVPLACINIQELVDKHNLKSMLINTVHDSVVVDIHPDEEITMVRLMREGASNVIKSLKDTYNIDFNVPLETEVKIGYDWLNLKEV